MGQYFDEMYVCFGGNEKTELDLPNYAQEDDLKGATGVHTSRLASKTELTSLKTKVDNLDIDKLKSIPNDSSKISNVMDVFKKN